MSYLVRFSYFLLVIALAWAGLKWATADFGIRIRWPDGMSTSPPKSFCYAYLPQSPEVLQHVGVNRLILVTQRELDEGQVGAYGLDGKHLYFPLSSFVPLDESKFDPSLIDETLRTYKLWNPDNAPRAMKLSFEGTQATFKIVHEEDWYDYKYEVEASAATVRAISHRSFSGKGAAFASAPVFLVMIVCVPLALLMGDRVIRGRAAKRKRTELNADTV